MLLRVEDIETPRVKLWAVDQIYEDLAWLTLDWDASPLEALPTGPPLQQSDRGGRYREVLQTLIETEAVYPCTCTRSEVAAAAAAAPHESQPDAAIYPGTCADRPAAEYQELCRRGIACCLRFRLGSGCDAFEDGFYGRQEINPRDELGDFVVWRVDDAAAYQLAVVIDDHDAGVNQIVRGADLILSTFRQRAVYAALGWEPPRHIHVPLVVGPDARRLAKRHGDTRLSTLRERGIRAEQLIGYLAARSGLVDSPRPLSAADLLKVDIFDRLRPEPLVFDAAAEFDAIREMR